MMTPKELATAIKQRKIPRTELADRMGISKGTLAHWLAGLDPIPARKQRVLEEIIAQETHPEYNAVAAFAVRFSVRELRKVKELWGAAATPSGMERLLRSLALAERRPRKNASIVNQKK